ncbi:MAG: protein-glutamate O-methyltransferase CheR [Clostridia bacterium]|nr:protein-glutamate O-methyltransferase CheR [Clostridia bacterium]MDD4571575.1 protein-glutamate O-methyltransferase CheR [Clostridia bacterium]
MIRLTEQEFYDIVSYVKATYGIDLSKKKQLIESRMYPILFERNLDNFTDYFNLVRGRNSTEITVMLNRLTTNHTYFMREPTHFEFLKNNLLPVWEKEKKEKVLRIWSAGCSSGEEAYTAIMVLKDYFGFQKWDYRILATDISARVIENAQNSVYSKDALQNIPKLWVNKYFIKKGDDQYILSEDVKKEVIFKYFNLMESFIFKNKFDLIFCRNVMIYFDQPTKKALIQKFYNVLNPGGYLFIGHSETIQNGSTDFKYIKPSIYHKE